VKFVSTALFALFFAAPAFASDRVSFMPENNLDLEDHLHAGSGLNEAQFNAVISRAEKIYKPLIKAKFGATLTVERRFADPTVNAFANQNSDTDWEVHMFGGLARRPEVTEDGFAMVLCHEIGHHIGGFPFVDDTEFAANEGQADTYATGACATKLFSKDAVAAKKARAAIPTKQKAACDAANRTQDGRDICYRGVLAGVSLANLLGTLEGSTVNLDTPDTSVVTTTDNEHPAAQCRLDTYVASALCGSSKWNDALIPGKRFANRNSKAAQTEAFAHSCVTGVSARPKCWFAAVK
jgi:hypothetical protein